MARISVASLLFLPETEEQRFLPEGPTSLGQGKFSWVAIQHGANASFGSLNIYDIASGENQSFELPGRPGFAKPTSRPGVFVVGCERQLGLFNTNDASWEVLTDEVDADVDGTIINDGTLYGDNIVFGTKDLEFATPKAGLYLFRMSDRKLLKLAGGQVCSNGKDVVDNGGELDLIDIDSPTKKVVRYGIDIEAGRLTSPTTIADLGDLEAVPDGMVLSPDEQSMIVSFYNPNPAQHGETRQYSLHDGSLEEVWQTPASPQNTCPLLLEMPGGGVKLIITTAVEHMPSERRQESKFAGGIFSSDTNFSTSPATPVLPLD
ncbi:MAG TPA: gluconolactonase [Planctomycetaceae bacterium]|nr:gluconolactonase [Planctomycetaceae bacterium]